MMLSIFSCRGEEDIQYPIDEAYALILPNNFPPIQEDFKDQKLTKYGVELGKKLFYDGRLASDNAVACAFCHIQENAFTHHGHSISHGVQGREGFRNAPPLQNLMYLKTYMWDGAVTELQQQPIIPITAHEEMDESMGNIVKKLQNDSEYKKLFKVVYGDESITAERILKSLTQFMSIMISADSKYDKVIRNEGAVFTAEESAGREIFNQKCASCHKTDLFTDHSYRNTGLAFNPVFKDHGRMRVSGLASDDMNFRVPSLRNVEYTAPYMHDGRFYSLKAVLDFYDSGVENQPNLDAELKKVSGKIGIPLSEQEKIYLIAFLKTLSDPKFITNPALAE